MLIVTGFHGSGTSAIVKRLAGFEIPFPGPHDCPGQMEFLGARAVNEHMLHTLTGHSWLRVPNYDELLNYPTEHAAKVPGVNWKDPRGCVTLPVWRERVDRVLWIKRDPLNVSKTINRIHNVPTIQVINLIAAYEYVLYRTLLEFKIPYTITVYESWYKEQDIVEAARIVEFCSPGRWINDEEARKGLSAMQKPHND